MEPCHGQRAPGRYHKHVALHLSCLEECRYDVDIFSGQTMRDAVDTWMCMLNVMYMETSKRKSDGIFFCGHVSRYAL